jgi:5-formyltetrahydrofolate cyclo-ligase
LKNVNSLQLAINAPLSSGIYPLFILTSGMLKSEARKHFLEKRLALSPQERAKLDDLMLIQLQTVPLPFITFLMSYWSIEKNKEPNTHLFSDYIEFRNPELITCYPKINPADGTMLAIQANDDTRFRKNKFEIYEPEDGDRVSASGIDIIFVPLLAVDKRGYRAGYGKGYYDRFMAGCRSDCTRIGFSYFEPLDTLEDTHEFDVPLNLCVTPTAVYVF